MSETIIVRGTLKEIAIKEKTFLDKIKFISKNYKNRKTDVFEYLDEKKEYICSDQFIYISGKMFERINETINDNYDDIIEIKKTSDGNYEYLLTFYTGGTCTEEILEDELNKLIKQDNNN